MFRVHLNVNLFKKLPIKLSTYKAVARIHGIGATEVKIVGVSADPKGMEAFIGAGADVFVLKPMALGIINHMLQEAIKLITKLRQEVIHAMKLKNSLLILA
jgi:hypothetical protein